MMSCFSNNLGPSSVIKMTPTLGGCDEDRYYSDDQDGTGMCLVLLYMHIPDFIQGYWPRSCLEKKSKDAVICQFGYFMFMYQLTIALSLCMYGIRGQMIAGE